MKKPNSLHKKFHGRKTWAGRAFAAVNHPTRTLRSIFGWDIAARDVAEGYNLSPSKMNIFRVLSVVKNWGKVYRGPKLSAIFHRFGWFSAPKPLPTHKPEPD